MRRMRPLEQLLPYWEALWSFIMIPPTTPATSLISPSLMLPSLTRPFHPPPCRNPLMSPWLLKRTTSLSLFSTLPPSRISWRYMGSVLEEVGVLIIPTPIRQDLVPFWVRVIVGIVTWDKERVEAKRREGEALQVRFTDWLRVSMRRRYSQPLRTLQMCTQRKSVL